MLLFAAALCLLPQPAAVAAASAIAWAAVPEVASQPCGHNASSAPCAAEQYCDPTNPKPNFFSRCGTSEATAWGNCTTPGAVCSQDSDCKVPGTTCYDDVNCGAGTCAPLNSLGDTCNWYRPCGAGLSCMCIDCAPVGPPPSSHCCKTGTIVGAQVCRGVPNAHAAAAVAAPATAPPLPPPPAPAVAATRGTAAATGLINVKSDFGAKGDGKTDDFAAIQAAIDCARSGANGTVPRNGIFFPPGNYLVTKTLQFSFWRGILVKGGEPGDSGIDGNDATVTITANLKVPAGACHEFSGSGYGTVQGIAFQGSNCRVMVLNARTANCVRPLPFANCVSLMTPLLFQQSAQQW